MDASKEANQSKKNSCGSLKNEKLVDNRGKDTQIDREYIVVSENNSMSMIKLWYGKGHTLLFRNIMSDYCNHTWKEKLGLSSQYNPYITEGDTLLAMRKVRIYKNSHVIDRQKILLHKRLWQAWWLSRATSASNTSDMAHHML